jgi:hypothetical protein
MWESCLSGSVRGRRTTEVWKRSCGTAAKAGGKQRKQTFSCSLGRLLPTRKGKKMRGWEGERTARCKPEVVKRGEGETAKRWKGVKIKLDSAKSIHSTQ